MMSCLAGIGGRLEGFIQKAKGAAEVAVIDGCAVGCGKAIMANAEIEKYNHIVLTDLGIEKNKNMNLAHEDVAKVKGAVRAACGKNSKAKAESDVKATTGGCCG